MTLRFVVACLELFAVADLTTAKSTNLLRQQSLSSSSTSSEPHDSDAINFPPSGGGYGKIGVKGHADPLFPVAPRSDENYGEDCMGLSVLSSNPLDNHVCEPCKRPDITGDDPACAAAYWQCRDSLCHPLCTQYALKCELSTSSSADPDGFFESVTSQGSIVAEALCAQISARWCSKPRASGGAGCCSANDHALFEWVESKTFDETGLRSLLPLAQCAHDHSDQELSDNMYVYVRRTQYRAGKKKNNVHLAFGAFEDALSWRSASPCRTFFSVSGVCRTHYVFFASFMARCSKCMKSLEISITSNPEKCQEWGSPGMFVCVYHMCACTYSCHVGCAVVQKK